MNITNYPSLIAFIISVACLIVYAFFLAPKQLQEVLKPRDFFTGLRWIILGILIVSIVTSIPSTIYQFYRSIGYEFTVLRAVSTVLSQVSKLGTTILLVLVFTYKRGS